MTMEDQSQNHPAKALIDKSREPIAAGAACVETVAVSLEPTPKQQYEARKAERKKLEGMERQLKERTEQIMTLDLLDRFVTAVEQIADALSHKSV